MEFLVEFLVELLVEPLAELLVQFLVELLVEFLVDTQSVYESDLKKIARKVVAFMLKCLHVVVFKCSAMCWLF